MPGFENLYRKMERSVSIGGKSESTLTNYGRCLATMALHYGISPIDLDEEQVLDYLHHLKSQSKTPSSSYFKHTLYGLRFAYKACGKSGLLPTLPPLKVPNKLPVILSEEEVKRLIKTPKLIKHRMALSLLYGCGLRRSELLNAKIEDADLERKMFHIRQGKGNKDRYVPLGENLVYALKKYLLSEQPYVYLFNGNGEEGARARFSETGVQWIIKEATKKAGIKKRVTSHDKFLFPVKAMSKVFRAKFMEELRKTEGLTISQATGKVLFSKKWVVYCKRPFFGPQQVVEYLGRYTHKIAISNHRIKEVENEKVTFSAKDYRHGGKKMLVTLSDEEFIRRFALHILPKRFVRIRHYGFLSSSLKKKVIPALQKELGKVIFKEQSSPVHRICPICKAGQLETILTFSSRGPPEDWQHIAQRIAAAV